MAVPRLSFETRAGNPIIAGKMKIIPFSRALTLRSPSGKPWAFGLLWNRPVSILVMNGNGEEQVLRVRDVTRWMQIYILVFSALIGLMIWRKSKSINS